METDNNTLCVCGHPKFNHPRDADCVGACYACDDGHGGQCDVFVPASEVKWPTPIPANERLPDNGQVVLFWTMGMDEFVPCIFDGGFTGFDGFELEEKTASVWLPMPPKPGQAAHFYGKRVEFREMEESKGNWTLTPLPKPE